MKESFDVFDFLRLSRREDVLHSPMLAGLLDTFGAHGVGDLFLRRFLALVVPQLTTTNLRWSVRQQQPLPNGRIDILLLCRSEEMAIVVETKIDAGEGFAQLPKYRDWLTTLSPVFVNTRVVFLTLDGQPSRDLPDEAIAISFKAVLTIIDECVQHVCAEFKPAVQLYRDTLARILNVQSAAAHTEAPAAERLTNLFRFLRISRREDVLHTRMLAGLLDPQASHGCGSTFLSAFLHLVLSPDSPALRTGCKWVVEAERKIPLGRIDIVLRCDDEAGVLIVIENKIDAAEGPQQLYRYARWMANEAHRYADQQLVFLTVEGVAPLTAAGLPVRQISYRDVRDLLEAAMGSAAISNRFAPVLRQYVDVLRGIVPEGERLPSLRLGRKLIPHPEHAAAALRFLEELVAKWRDLPVSGQIRPKRLDALFPVLTPDTTNCGKYNKVELWPAELVGLMTQQLIVPLVEVCLSNRSPEIMGVWVGLHWRNTRVGSTNAHWLQCPEGDQLLRVAAKLRFRLSSARRDGQWIGIAEPLENPGTDAALAASLNNHADDLHRSIVARLYNIWLLCGDDVMRLNRKLVADQSATYLEENEIRSRIRR